MKNMKVFIRDLCAGHTGRPAKYGMAVLFALAIALTGCDKKAEQRAIDPTNSATQNSLRDATTASLVLPVGNVDEVKLVADITSLGARRTDANLVNAWGIAFAPHEYMVIASNGKGRAMVYNENGEQRRDPIDIPLNGVNYGAAPSGVVYNTGAFTMPGAPGAVGTRDRVNFFFSTEDGIIAAWNSALTTQTVIDRSSTGAVYKGIAIASSGGHDYIYATDFHNNKIDVFDEQYNPVTGMQFSDAKIPTGFAPFNIQNIDGKLYVTYAMQKLPDKHDDQAGPGNGYIDVYNTDGSFFNRIGTQGALNSPWGLAETETQGRPEHLLVGNFGDGRINVFDMQGNFIGQVAAAGKAVTIPGLWGLAFDQDGGREFEHGGQGPLYFTSGPNSENDGLFGYMIGVRSGFTNTVPSVKVVAPPAPISAHN